MIKNKSIYTKEDYLFFYKCNGFKLSSVMCQIVIVLLGIDGFKRILPLIKAKFIYNAQLNIEQIFCLVVCFCLSIYCVSYPLHCKYSIASSNYKKMGKNRISEVEFFEDDFVIKDINKGIINESHIPYSLVDGFYEKNHTVYVRFRVGKQKGFAILGDDSYVKGEKSDLLVFLDSKGIRKL